MRLFTFLYLLFNYRAFTRKTPIAKEITLLLFVFLFDVFAWLNPVFLLETFGRSIAKGIAVSVILIELVLFCVCYLKNQTQRYVNHYIFLSLVLISALSLIGYGFTQNQFVMLASMLGAAGAGIFGLLNLRYGRQQ